MRRTYLMQSTWKVGMLTCEIMAKRRGVDLEEFEDVSGVTQPSPNAKFCGVVHGVSADAQLFFFHSHAVVFHNFVFCISGCVLWSGVVVSPPSLPS